MKKIIKKGFAILIVFLSFTATLFADDIYTKNGHISYSESGHGQTIVLIHAFPTDQQLWVPQIEGLNKYFHIITIDLWGFGHSEATDGKAIPMDNYAEEIKQLLDKLHIQNAIIAGESMGGYIALAFLKNYPDKTAGLILSDTQAIADSPETKIKREASAIDILEHGTTLFINNFMTKALSSAANEETKQFLKNILSRQSQTAMASALRGMALREDASNVLANTSSNILIITGEQDILISPQQSYAMHKLAKNSQMVIIKNAGHLSSLEQPDQWNQAVISRFLSI